MKLQSEQANCEGEPIYLKGMLATLESYNGQYTIEGKFAEDVLDPECNYEFFDTDADETIVVNGYQFEVVLS